MDSLEAHPPRAAQRPRRRRHRRLRRRRRPTNRRSRLLDELARFTPTDAAAITFVDFAAAREQLGLPADADALVVRRARGRRPREPDARGAAGRGRGARDASADELRRHASRRIRPLRSSTAPRSRRAVNTIGEGFPMTVIHTEQPFSEIADGPDRARLHRGGSTVTQEGERFEQVADAGDGIVVIGNNGAAADAVAADEATGPTALLDLLEPADQPIAGRRERNPRRLRHRSRRLGERRAHRGHAALRLRRRGIGRKLRPRRAQRAGSHHRGGAERRRRHGRDRLHGRAGRPAGQPHPRDADPVRLRLRLRLRRGRTPQAIAV